MRSLFFLLFLSMALPAWASITFSPSGKWETSFTYDTECSQNDGLGNLPCTSVANDDIDWYRKSEILNGYSSEVVASANNPTGKGGFGFRSWNGDGSNNNTGKLRISFKGPQKELWIRWFQRYEAGFGWSGTSPRYCDLLRIVADSKHIALLHHTTADKGGAGGFALTNLASTPSSHVTTWLRRSWNDIFGLISDGEWHLFEVHLKMDSGVANGEGHLWIDGKLIAASDTINWSLGNQATQRGWNWVEFHGDQSYINNNGRIAHVDFDDIVIFNTTPQGKDSADNAWIGPHNIPTPSCSDSIQNQGETAVDCGGPCSPCPTSPNRLKEKQIARDIPPTENKPPAQEQPPPREKQVKKTEPPKPKKKKLLYFQDRDGDGFPAAITKRSDKPPGPNWYLKEELKGLAEDCDDFNFTIHPGAREILGNGIADDCEGSDHFSITFTRPTFGTITGDGIRCGAEHSDVDCEENYEEGTTQYFTLTFDTSSVSFNGWQGDATGNDIPLALKVDSNKTITADLTTPFSYTMTFLRPTTGTITGNGIDCGINSYDCTASYLPDSVQNFQLQYNQEYFTFDGWRGAASGNKNPLSIHMTSNKIIGVNFSTKKQ